MTFFCRAVENSKKCVKQSRFEQLQFEQLTLTQKIKCTYLNYFLFQVILSYFLDFLKLCTILSKPQFFLILKYVDGHHTFYNIKTGERQRQSIQIKKKVDWI
jgi:hypothetical protein